MNKILAVIWMLAWPITAVLTFSVFKTVVGVDHWTPDSTETITFLAVFAAVISWISIPLYLLWERD